MPVDTENIQRHLSTISKINVLLAVMALIGVGALYTWLRWGMDTPELVSTNQQTNQNANQNSNQQTNADAEQITEDYQNSVNEILDGFDFRDAAGAQARLEQVIELRFPSSFRAVQLQVVAALQEASSGKYDDANQRITQLKAEYSWFLQ